MTTTKHILISDIDIPTGRRALQADRVTDLAQSMQKVGLLSPIRVRMIKDKPVLVYGRHRHAAAVALGWEEIDCQLLDADDRQARMVEIAENLHRAELTVLERAEQIAEWIKLVEEERISAQLARKTGPGRPEGGVAAAARELGVDRDVTRRAQVIASLPAAAKVAAQELALDNNQSAMLKAAKAPDPVAALEAHAERRRHHVQIEPEAARDEKALKEERKADRAARKERERQQEADKAAAIDTVAGMLVDGIEDMHQFIELMKLVEYDFLFESGLGEAIHARRSDLCNWFDEDDEPGEARVLRSA